MGIYWQIKCDILYISIFGGELVLIFFNILQYMHGPSMIYTAMKTKTALHFYIIALFHELMLGFT